jgi:uncharacterized OB-fold protein
MTQVAPLLPDVSNPLLRPHWAAAAEGRLEIPYCAQCGIAQWPPRPNCLRCHAFEVDWREVDRRGRLYSYFVAHKPLHPSVESEVPYAAGSVELSAGVKMLGRVIDIALGDIELGMGLEARFVERAPGVTLVYWGPDQTS